MRFDVNPVVGFRARCRVVVVFGIRSCVSFGVPKVLCKTFFLTIRNNVLFILKPEAPFQIAFRLEIYTSIRVGIFNICFTHFRNFTLDSVVKDAGGIEVIALPLPSQTRGHK